MSQQLTAPQMADLLGITVRQLYRLQKEGLPCFREGRSVTYDSAEVIAWRVNWAVSKAITEAFAAENPD